MKIPVLSLRSRFAVWTFVLISAVLACFSFFLYVQLSHNLRSALDETLRVSGSEVIAAIEIEHGKIGGLDHRLDEIVSSLTEKGFSLRILSSDGSALATYGPLKAYPRETPRGRTEKFITVKDSRGEEYRLLDLPITEHGKDFGILQIAVSWESIEDTIRQLAAILLFAGPLLALVAAAGAYALASGAVRPLERVTETARRITSKNLFERIDTARLRGDEIGILATTFNGMIGRLEESFKREQRFVADASHELRTPLAAMQAIIGVTNEKRRGAAEYQQAMADLEEEVCRLRGLTEELLTLVRLNGGKPSDIEEIELADLTDDAAQTMAPLAEAKGLALSLDLERGTTVRGSRDALVRLLVNLLDNAIKYTDAGSISITVRRVDTGGSELVVADTGRGIPPEEHDLVFDRFYRAEKSRTSPGSGLGLSIAKEIVISMDGWIGVESRPGAGSRFIVRFS